MTSKERFIAALSGEKADRMPITEIGVWPETEERWRQEGLPEGVGVEEHFGLDIMCLTSYDSSLRLPSIICDETDEYVIATDGDGCKYKRWKNAVSTPQFMGTTVRTPEDWAKIKSGLEPDISRYEDYDVDFRFGSPLGERQKSKYDRESANGYFTVISPVEPCWYYLRLLGEEEALCTMISDPDFAEQIMRDYNEFTIKQLETILSAGYTFDALWVFSDLCYKNGMLFSPSFFRQYVMPLQKKLFAWAHEHGMKVIYHSDGNVKDLIPLLIECGIDCMQPLEARAGNDVREYYRLYGDKISFIGNINADMLAGTKDDIYTELTEKVTVMRDTGRYIYHSDHSIPYTVSYENFRYSIELAKKLGAHEL